MAVWERKCELIIQGSKVEVDCVDFPVLLTEDTLPSEMFDADGAYPAASGGGDIKFASDEDGTNQIPCEIVTFTTDNDPANGKAEIWVKMDISASSNTSIWVFYCKSGETQPAADSDYGSEAVWSSGFTTVHHMGETPPNNILDSTSRGLDGVPTNMEAADQTAGQIGGSLNFDGTNEYVKVDVDDAISYTSSFTESTAYSQGVATDGTNLYITAKGSAYPGTIVKRSKTGTLITSRALSSSTDHVTQIADLFYKDNYLYVADATAINDRPNSTGGRTVRSNASDLTYDSVVLSETTTNYFTEGVTFYNNHWWLSFWSGSTTGTGNILIRKYNTSWNFQKEYTLTNITGDAQGIDFYEENGKKYLITTTHNEHATYGGAISLYEYDSTADTITYKGIKAKETSHAHCQGFMFESQSDASVLWVADRLNTKISKEDFTKFASVLIEDTNVNRTIGGWFYAEAVDSMVIARYNGLNSAKDFQIWVSTDTSPNRIRLVAVETNLFADITLNTWYFFHAVCSYTSQELYLNGVLADSDTMTTPAYMTNTDEPWLIGTDPDAAGGGGLGNWFDGKIDNITIASETRTAGWIKTEYNNQNSPSTFIMVDGAVIEVGLETGTYNLTGNAVNLARGLILSMDAGSYTLTGNDLGFKRNLVLNLDTGSYSLTGNDIDLNYIAGYTLDLDTGSYSLTGNDLGFKRNLVLNLDTGSYSLTGNDIDLSRGLFLGLDTGSYSLTGNDVSLNYTTGNTLGLNTGLYALTGNDITCKRNLILNLDTGIYTLTGNNIVFTSEIIPAIKTYHFNPVDFEFSFNPINFTININPK